jgi:hypothetical protein
MKRISNYLIIGILFPILLLGILWSCNVSDPGKTTVLNLSVPDSLSVEQGLYSAIRVDIYDGENKLVYPAIYNRPYKKASDSTALANLVLANGAPNPMIIVITGIKGDKEVVKITYRIQDKVVSNPEVKLIDQATTNPPPNTGGGEDQPQSISILTDNPLSLRR